MKRDNIFLNLILGIGLGYAINFVLALIAIFSFDVDILFKHYPKNFEEALKISFYVSIYGMGVGLLTELLFKGKVWLRKLPIHFLAILFSPTIILFAFIEHSFIFFLSMPLWGVLATSLYMYWKSFEKVDIITYAVGYIFIFLGFLFASFFLRTINLPEGIIFILLFPVIGVGLCKSFFRCINKGLANENK